MENSPEEALARALAEAARADDAGEAGALLLAGEIEAARDRPEEAIAFLRRAAALAERAGDATVLRQSLEKTGALSLTNGRPGLALDALRRHLEVVEAASEARFVGRAHGLLGFALQKLGQYEAALAHYRRSSEHYRSQGGGVGELSNLLNIGTVQGEWLGRFDEAAGSFRRILELAERRDDVPAELVGLAWLNLAEALADAGRPAEALPCVESAADVFARIDHRPYRARAASTASEILLLLDRPRDAEAAARAALDHARQAGDADVRRLAHLRRGRALAALGRGPEALEQLEAAANALEELRRDIGIEEMQISFLRDKRETYEAWIAQLHRLHRGDLATGWDAVALRASESSRCRSFIDHLPRPGGAVPAPEPIGLDEVRRVVGAGRVLLEYFFGRERVYLFVIGADRTSFADIGSARELGDRLAFAVGDLRARHAPQGATILAQQLVLDPLGGSVPEASLIVVPDGPLFSLPLEALLRAAGIDPPPVSYVPSATVLAWSAETAGPPAPRPAVLSVAAADPGVADPALPPLRLAGREARRAASFFDERGRRLLIAGTREPEVRAALGQGATVVHFAAHARVDEADPGRSGLLLHAADHAAAREEADGLLSAREVAQVTIDARLVVLSGCTTSGSEVAPGEGVLGLGRAFLRAGASALLVTLWDVSDVTAFEVTGRFYEEASRGIPLDAALSRAVRDLDHLADAKAFVLVGNGRTVLEGLTAPTAAGRRLVAAGLILAALLLVLVAPRVRARGSR